MIVVYRLKHKREIIILRSEISSNGFVLFIYLGNF